MQSTVLSRVIEARQRTQRIQTTMRLGEASVLACNVNVNFNIIGLWHCSAPIHTAPMSQRHRGNAQSPLLHMHMHIHIHAASTLKRQAQAHSLTICPRLGSRGAIAIVRVRAGLIGRVDSFGNSNVNFCRSLRCGVGPQLSAACVPLPVRCRPVCMPPRREALSSQLALLLFIA